MKALTLWQPWASLVAVGVKTIETRSWSTSYRGPLAIHASKRKLSLRDGSMDLWWAEHDRLSKVPIAADGAVPEYALPLGAVVATCELVNVAPIGGPDSFRTGLVEGDEGDLPGRPVVVRHPAIFDGESEALVLDHEGKQADISDQLPYGDFTSGRYAWVLAGIKALSEPLLATGHQGLWACVDLSHLTPSQEAVPS